MTGPALFALSIFAVLAGCSGAARITPEQAALRDTSLTAQAAATGAQSRAQTVQTPLSLDRPVCGPDAPLSLDPVCRPLPPVRDRAASVGPDSAAWYAQRQRDAERRNALIENRNERLRLDNDTGPFAGQERARLDRERMMLERQQNLAPQRDLSVSPFARTTGRYGL